jgi:hypothetical protein
MEIYLFAHYSTILTFPLAVNHTSMPFQVIYDSDRNAITGFVIRNQRAIIPIPIGKKKRILRFFECTHLFLTQNIYETDHQLLSFYD